jgi:hypothetical protein
MFILSRNHFGVNNYVVTTVKVSRGLYTFMYDARVKQQPSLPQTLRNSYFTFLFYQDIVEETQSVM